MTEKMRKAPFELPLQVIVDKDNYQATVFDGNGSRIFSGLIPIEGTEIIEYYEFICAKVNQHQELLQGRTTLVEENQRLNKNADGYLKDAIDRAYCERQKTFNENKDLKLDNEYLELENKKLRGLLKDLSRYSFRTDTLTEISQVSFSKTVEEFGTYKIADRVYTAIEQALKEVENG